MDDLIRYNKILVLLYFGGKFSRSYYLGVAQKSNGNGLF